MPSCRRRPNSLSRGHRCWRLRNRTPHSNKHRDPVVRQRNGREDKNSVNQNQSSPTMVALMDEPPHSSLSLPPSWTPILDHWDIGNHTPTVRPRARILRASATMTQQLVWIDRPDRNLAFVISLGRGMLGDAQISVSRPAHSIAEQRLSVSGGRGEREGEHGRVVGQERRASQWSALGLCQFQIRTPKKHDITPYLHNNLAHSPCIRRVHLRRHWNALAD